MIGTLKARIRRFDDECWYAIVEPNGDHDWIRAIVDWLEKNCKGRYTTSHKSIFFTEKEDYTMFILTFG